MISRLPSRPRDGATLRLEELAPVRLGMPEMCSTGLSENWLWKACGHRHWMALAAAHGLERPDFRDDRGNRLYPAFTSVMLEDARLDAAREHALLDFSVVLSRTGRSRFSSSIALSIDGDRMAKLTMESAFIGRAIEGENRSVRRGLVAGPCGLLVPSAPQAPFKPAGWSVEEGFVRAERRELATTLIDPTPDEDFNGVGLLYCAAFQSILARAEWTWFRRHSPAFVTRRRRIHYMGNAELGDRIRATLCGSREHTGDIATWIELTRESDGALIALSFTSRRPARRRSA